MSIENKIKDLHGSVSMTRATFTYADWLSNEVIRMEKEGKHKAVINEYVGKFLAGIIAEAYIEGASVSESNLRDVVTTLMFKKDAHGMSTIDDVNSYLSSIKE